MDREHARLVEAHLKQHGVNLALGDGVAGFKQAANGSLVVDTKSGKTHPADLVILALGVRPDTTLAKQAGLAIGERGGIRVDEHMRTSHPDIFAVGDAVEVKDFVTGQWSLIALAIQMGATIYDLEEAELCYAPQFGSAKDPVNFAGMIAGDVLRGDMPICHWDAVNGAFLLDVREPAELALESAPGAVHIPIGELRARLGELPRDRAIHVICRSGQRAYYATRVLLQHGFKARNLSGGFLSRAILSADFAGASAPAAR
jgi:rhodanese-related sulfurtransferase